MGGVLKTNAPTKEFASKTVVDHLSITVGKGDIYGFIVENGAGKTTLMRMVCGLAEPTSGSMQLFESGNLTAMQSKVGWTIENPALYPAMTAMENMETQRLLRGIKDNTCCHTLLNTVEFDKTGKKKSKDFSLGMKQRLMIENVLQKTQQV